MNVLYPRVGQVDLATKEKTPLHVDPLLVEAIAHGLVTKKEQRKRKDREGSRQDYPDEVELQEVLVRPLNGEELFLVQSDS
jgi:hypothetical protein